MKQVTILLATVLFATLISGCGSGRKSTTTEAETTKTEMTEIEMFLPGKIAIISAEIDRFSWLSERQRFFATEALVAKYGEENIVHFQKPRFILRQPEREQKREIFNTIAQNPKIKVLIINDAGSSHTDYFVSILRQQRNDIFIIYAEYIVRYDDRGVARFGTNNSPANGTALANLILDVNWLEFNNRIPIQAQKLGAKTLVLFGHSDMCEFCDVAFFCKDFVAHNYHARMMRTKSEEIGLNFTHYDSRRVQCGSSEFMFISDIMPEIFNKYGTDIVFQELDGLRLLHRIFAERAFFIPSYFSSSPYHFFENLHFATSPEMSALTEMEPKQFFHKTNLPNIIEAIRNELEKVDMLGRVATKPVSVHSMFTYIGVKYGIKWMKGEVPDDGIDKQVLEQIILNYLAKATGTEDFGVTITPFSHEGVTYQNFLLLFLDYMIY